jgi:CTP synthase
LGLTPQVILCRSTAALELDVKRKISGFCHVRPEHVLSVYDVQNIYHVPLLLVQQNLHNILCEELQLFTLKESPSASLSLPQSPDPISTQEMLVRNPDLKEWSDMAHAVDNYTSKVKIALIGKYTGLQDSYLSVIKSLKHATMACGVDLEISWVDACHLVHDPTDASFKTDVIHDQAQDSTLTKEEQERLSAQAWAQIESCDGVVVPGGFGNR